MARVNVGYPVIAVMDQTKKCQGRALAPKKEMREMDFASCRQAADAACQFEDGGCALRCKDWV